jgi:hypothetical protein
MLLCRHTCCWYRVWSGVAYSQMFRAKAGAEVDNDRFWGC